MTVMIQDLDLHFGPTMCLLFPPPYISPKSLVINISEKCLFGKNEKKISGQIIQAMKAKNKHVLISMPDNENECST